MGVKFLIQFQNKSQNNICHDFDFVAKPRTEYFAPSWKKKF